MSSQIVANIIYSFTIYLIVALSFHIIYVVTKFFHFSHAIIIALGAYFSWFFMVQLHFTIIFSIFLGISFSVLLAILLETIIYKPLRKRHVNPFVLLIASLGIYTIFQNLISLIWGDDIKSFQMQSMGEVYKIFGASISKIQILTFLICFVSLAIIIIFFSKTKYGRKIRAVSSNEGLSNIFGIDSDKVILLVFVIGSALAAVIGILVAFDTDLRPTMGFNLLLYGVVAMIIGGVDSMWGLVSGALLLATTQNLASYYFSSQWMNGITYIILILFLIWKPLGFSGKRLKKVEI